MTERYTKLFSLQSNLYSEGAPVVIAAGALLKDNMSNSVLAQLKFLNISNDQIKALTVSIIPMDISGKIFDRDVKYQYLDLSVSRNNYFGNKNPIKLENNAIRSFYVRVDEVIFTNNTTWTSAGGEWTPLRIQESIESSLGNLELIKQYELEYGKSCRYTPTKDRDLWLCSCGAINHIGEDKCYLCKNDVGILSLNMESLKSKAAARLKNEHEIKVKKEKTIKNIALSVIAFCMIFIAVVSAVVFTVTIHRKNVIYTKALDLSENGQYSEAVEMLEELGDYKDSVKEKTYARAMQYSQNGQYALAKITFDRLGGYKDSVEQSKTAFDNMIDTFGQSDDIKEYFSLFAKTYEILSGDELKNAILGHWNVTNSGGELEQYTFNADGTIDAKIYNKEASEWRTQSGKHTWDVDGDTLLYYLILSSDERVTPSEYTVRKLSDDILLFYHRAWDTIYMLKRN